MASITSAGRSGNVAWTPKDSMMWSELDLNTSATPKGCRICLVAVAKARSELGSETTGSCFVRLVVPIMVERIGAKQRFMLEADKRGRGEGEPQHDFR